MRYAIYHAPALGGTLHVLGSSWLGRDAFSGQPIRQPEVEGLPEVTAAPRRYGLHATLKPPFALSHGRTRGSLGNSVAALAGQAEVIPGVKLELALLDGFLALIPALPDARIAELEQACIRDLDAFRAAASEDELNRRRSTGLTPRQERYLERWGYPYVLDEFRFHITLTERLDPARIERFTAAAEKHFDDVLRNPIAIGEIAIFRQTAPGADFIVEDMFQLRPMSAARAAS